MADAIETADAMRMAGLSRQAWNDALSRGHYTEAPATRPGAVRLFDRDDIVALVCFDHLARSCPKALAAKIASAIRRELRRTPPATQSLYLVLTDSGEPSRIVATKPAGFVSHEIMIGDVRRAVAERVAKRAATEGKA